MASSRKSPNLNKESGIQQRFERALGDILARVSISASSQTPTLGVAYSGGLDSSVLLHMACQYAEKHEIRVHAFHVHHGLSPNADMWLAHCEETADRYEIRFDAARVIVSGIDQHGLEQAARIARYQALGKLCRTHGVNLLLTAHHQDDQAETVVLQMLRGAGLPGLSGMAAFQEDQALLGGSVLLGRPLLGISRSFLEEQVILHKIQFILDESNADPIFRRNALRHEIFPVIEKHFPSFAPLIARSAAHTQTAQTLLQDLASIDLASCRCDGEEKELDLERLSTLSEERIDNLLRHWLHASGLQFPSTARMEEIREQIFSAANDRHPVFDFGQVVLNRIGKRLAIVPNLGQPPSEYVMLHWHGQAEIEVPLWHGKLILKPSRDLGIDPEKLFSHVLKLGERKGNERLKVAHNRPSRSLKNLFQESCVPTWQRKWLPILYSGTDLLFVAGLGMDVRHATVQNGIEISWEPDWK